MKEEHEEFKIFTKGDYSSHFPHMGMHGKRMFRKFGPKSFSIEIDNEECCGPSMKKSRGHVSQIVKDTILHVFLMAPGLNKDSIKIRSKPDKLTFSGELRDDLKDLMGEKTIKKVIGLHEIVDPNQAKADYRDGVMHISFPIVETGEPITLD